jgi:hypothetical protein
MIIIIINPNRTFPMLGEGKIICLGGRRGGGLWKLGFTVFTV